MRLTRNATAFLLSVGAILRVAVGLLGGVALLGWLLDVDLLKRVAVSPVPMKANTAVCLILLSGALGGYQHRQATGWRRLGAACAAFAAVIALATLGEYVLGWRLGVDELLFRDHAIRRRSLPGSPGVQHRLGGRARRRSDRALGRAAGALVAKSGVWPGPRAR